MPTLYMALRRGVVGPLVNLLLRPEVRGLEHVPRTGPAILASNHLSFLDPVLLPVAVPRPVSFLAKAEYFTAPGPLGRAMAAFFRAIHQIPLDRSGGQRSAGALEAARAVLAEGQLLGIYPEGTRSPDGRLHRPKLGVARLALQTGVPVLPVAMIGTQRLQPPGARLPRLPRPLLRPAPEQRPRTVIGPPLDLSAWTGPDAGGHAARGAAQQIIAAIRELSGQDYVDEYAPRRGGHGTTRRAPVS